MLSSCSSLPFPTQSRFSLISFKVQWSFYPNFFLCSGYVIKISCLLIYLLHALCAFFFQAITVYYSDKCLWKIKHWGWDKIWDRSRRGRKVKMFTKTREFISIWLGSYILSFKHCWPMTVSGEISLREKMLKSSVTGVEENLIFFLIRQFAKTVLKV